MVCGHCIYSGLTITKYMWSSFKNKDTKRDYVVRQIWKKMQDPKAWSALCQFVEDHDVDTDCIEDTAPGLTNDDGESSDDDVANILNMAQSSDQSKNQHSTSSNIIHPMATSFRRRPKAPPKPPPPPRQSFNHKASQRSRASHHELSSRGHFQSNDRKRRLYQNQGRGDEDEFKERVRIKNDTAANMNGSSAKRRRSQNECFFIESASP